MGSLEKILRGLKHFSSNLTIYQILIILGGDLFMTHAFDLNALPLLIDEAMNELSHDKKNC